jgi:hypothetical protein
MSCAPSPTPLIVPRERVREFTTSSLMGLASLWPNCMMTKSPGFNIAATRGH